MFAGAGASFSPQITRTMDMESVFAFGKVRKKAVIITPFEPCVATTSPFTGESLKQAMACVPAILSEAESKCERHFKLKLRLQNVFNIGQVFLIRSLT